MSDYWPRHIVAMIGGDEREREIAKEAIAAGARVKAFGIPRPGEAIAGVTMAPSAEEAAQDATVLLLPLPGMKGLIVFAPHRSEPIVIDDPILRVLAPSAQILCGRASDEFDESVRRFGFALHEYEHDEAGRIARAPAIAEGAIASIVHNTDRTIDGAQIGVVGFGVVGSFVAAALARLGATISVFARSDAQREAAQDAGHKAAPLGSLVDSAASFDMLVSTAPAPVVTEDVLRQLRGDAVVFDLASPPGSVDQQAVSRLGTRFVWARGLGSTAPVAVGRAQWSVIDALLRGVSRAH